MDVPILTAVISVSGALVGTIVGGCLTMYSNFFLNKRRERAEFRIGCRLIAGELAECAGYISAEVADKRWYSLEIEPGVKSWEEHQHVLASYLSYEAWFDVRVAIRMVHFAHYARAEKQGLIDDAAGEKLAGYVKDIQRGQARLDPYVGRRRLLEPLRIRPRIPRPSISG